MNEPYILQTGNWPSNLRRNFSCFRYRSPTTYAATRVLMLLVGLVVCNIIGGHITSAKAQSPDSCAELKHFALTELPDEWDRAAKKYRISSEALAEYDRIKRQLLDDTWLVNNGVFEAAALLTAGAKLLADTIDGVIDTFVPTKTLYKGAAIKSIKVYKALKAGREIVDISNSTKKQLTINHLNEALNPLKKATKVAMDFAENLETMNDLANSQKDIKGMVRSQLRTLNKAVSKYRRSAEQSRARGIYIRAFVNGIAQYCNQAEDEDKRPGRDLFTAGKKPKPFEEYLSGDNDPDEIRRADQNYRSIDRQVPIRVNPELGLSTFTPQYNGKKNKTHGNNRRQQPRPPKVRRTQPQPGWTDSAPGAQNQ